MSRTCSKMLEHLGWFLNRKYIRVPGVSLVTRVLEYSHLSAMIAACMAASTRPRSITSLSSSDKEDPPPFFLAAIGICHHSIYQVKPRLPFLAYCLYGVCVHIRIFASGKDPSLHLVNQTSFLPLQHIFAISSILARVSGVCAFT